MVLFIGKSFGNDPRLKLTSSLQKAKDMDFEFALPCPLLIPKLCFTILKFCAGNSGHVSKHGPLRKLTKGERMCEHNSESAEVVVCKYVA